MCVEGGEIGPCRVQQALFMLRGEGVEALADPLFRLQGADIGRADGKNAARTRTPVEQEQVFRQFLIGFFPDDDDPLFEGGGQQVPQGMGSLGGVALKQGTGGDGLPDINHGLAAGLLGIGEVHADGHDEDFLHIGILLVGSGNDAPYAFLDGPQSFFVQSHALREDHDGLVAAQGLIASRKSGKVVFKPLVAQVYDPVDGDHLEGAEEKVVKGLLEKIAPHQIAQGLPHENRHQARLHERRRVVGGQDDGLAPRDALEVGKVDFPVVDQQGQPGNGSNYVVEHGVPYRVKIRFYFWGCAKSPSFAPSLSFQNNILCRSRRHLPPPVPRFKTRAARTPKSTSSSSGGRPRVGKPRWPSGWPGISGRKSCRPTAGSSTGKWVSVPQNQRSKSWPKPRTTSSTACLSTNRTTSATTSAERWPVWSACSKSGTWPSSPGARACL